MDKHSLKLFCDLVETRSFTKAAARNYMTQSAVSHRLRALEEHYQGRLIDRGHGQFNLTQKGHIVRHHALQILTQYRQLEVALARPGAEVAGPLRVAAIYTVGLFELPHYTTPFLRRYRKVDLRLQYLHTPEVYDALLTSRIDLGFVDYPRPHPHLTLRPFTNQRLVLIVDPRHPWRKRRRIPLQQLADAPFITSPKELPPHHVFDAMFRRAGIQVRYTHTFDNIEVVKRAVMGGLGLSIVPEICVRDDVRGRQLYQLEFSEGPLERPVGILSRKHEGLPPAAERFIETLKTPPRLPRR